ncbi:hypothetical protein D3C72_2486830 [compost metagenome]
MPGLVRLLDAHGPRALRLAIGCIGAEEAAASVLRHVLDAPGGIAASEVVVGLFWLVVVDRVHGSLRLMDGSRD